MRKAAEAPAPSSAWDATKSLAELYAGVDGEIGSLGLACSSCGRCCDFRSAEHVLYATPLEREYFFSAPPPCKASEKGMCPYWEAPFCRNRVGRALGCRTYFCADTAAGQRVYEKYHGKLRELHARLGLPYEYGRIF